MAAGVYPLLPKSQHASEEWHVKQTEEEIEINDVQKQTASEVERELHVS